MKKLFTILLLSLLIANTTLGANTLLESNTLYEYYNAKGLNLPQISERAVIYQNIANDIYTGSFKQNLALLDYLKESQEFLGGNVPASAVNWTLAAPITSTQTTIDLTDFDDLRGNAIATTSMPTKVYLVVEPENPDNTEIIMCLSANGDETNTQFTSCVRGLAFSGTAETAVTANQKSHPSGATVIQTNVGQFFNNFIDLDSAQTISAIKTFSVSPIAPSPTTASQVAIKSYVDGVAIQGGATSTETVLGLSQLATTAEQAGNTFDSNNPTVLSTKYASSTSANNYVIIANGSGELDNSFIDDNPYDFNGDITLNGETTLATTTFSVTPVFPLTYLPYTQSTSSLQAGEPLTAEDGVYIATSTNDTTITSAKTWSGSANNSTISANSWFSVEININTNVTRINGLTLNATAVATGGNVVVALYSGDNANPNAGTLLSSKTEAIVGIGETVFTFDTPVLTTLTTNNYFFIIKGEGSTSITENYVTQKGSTGSGAKLYTSSNSGSTWPSSYYQNNYDINVSTVVDSFIYKSNETMFDGFTSETGITSDYVEVVVAGLASVSGTTAGNAYYLDSSGGVTTVSSGSNETAGFCLNNNEIFIMKNIK